ncbi:hypothetical protein M0802_004713 [Mischocyttarus mexicanus]|nr:hypothetical protein M0802_004713 [Mischocyttarus mexicanus]
MKRIPLTNSIVREETEISGDKRKTCPLYAQGASPRAPIHKISIANYIPVKKTKKYGDGDKREEVEEVEKVEEEEEEEEGEHFTKVSWQLNRAFTSYQRPPPVDLLLPQTPSTLTLSPQPSALTLLVFHLYEDSRATFKTLGRGNNCAARVQNATEL